ncbi:MAG: carbohydrate ABC transporter permease [Anaerolineales bacterium]|nr:carbohydrate ABC transporter permease [Anaerolineales bacterium]
MRRWWRQGLAAVAAGVFLLPLYWAVVASLRQPGLPPTNGIAWWPTQPHWDNYLEIFRLLPLGRYLGNSLLVVAIAVPVTVGMASGAGFAMSQLAETARERLMRLSVALLLIPGAAVWLFRFQILRGLGLLDTVWALVLPAFAGSNPLFILLFYWTCRRIPPELFEAARLEGANAWTLWRRLALPLSRPTLVGVVVLTFVAYWSDFISPVLYIFDPRDYTVAVGLQILKQMDPTNWSLLMAAAVFMSVPVIILFLVLQRFFLHDLSLAHLFDEN